MGGFGGPDRGSPRTAVDRRAFLRVAGGSGVGVLGGLGGIPTAGATGGDERWRYETGDAVASSPTVVDGTVFVGSDDGNLYALDAESGDERWRAATDEAVFSSPTVVDGTVYVGSKDNYLHAFDAESGDREWRFRTSHDVVSSPTVADGTVVVGSWDASVYGVDAATGEERWEFPTGGLVYASPTVHDGTVYVGSWDTYVYALDLETGDELWSYDVNGQVYSSATVADGTVYVGTHGNSVYALDAATGEGLWRADAADSVLPSLTVHDGTVYAGSWDHRVYALDADSGEPQWRFDAGSRVGSSPTIAGGTVFVGTVGEALLAIDAETGEERWEFATGGTVDSSPIVVDGTVYVGSADGNVYAVDAGVDGDSEGSRVESGTLGHHHAFAGEGASGDGSGADVSIENLRLVQTVENSRVIDRDGRLNGLGEFAPVADELVLDAADDAIAWTAAKPPLVEGRHVAPVFDLDVTNPDGATEPVVLRGRLLDGDESLLERTATIQPAAIRGQDSERTFQLEDLYEAGTVDRLPLLEMLALDPDLVDGDYPTLPGFSRFDVEVEVGGPAVDAAVTERVTIDPDRTATMPTLTIGIVPLERDLVADSIGYRFDGEPDVTGYAEEVAQYVFDTYPVTELEVVVLEDPIRGPSMRSPVDLYTAVTVAEGGLAARRDDARTFELFDGGIRADDVDAGAVDVTLGVVPEDEFFEGIPFVDDDTMGVHPSIRFVGPFTAASLAEIGDPTNAAHEMGHYFLGKYYDDDPAIDLEEFRGSGGPFHASIFFRSTGFVHRNGSLEVRPAQTAMMSYTDESIWTDAHMYRGLVESEFRGYGSWSSTESAASFDAGTSGRLAATERQLASVRDIADRPEIDGSDTDLETLRSTIESMRTDIDDGLAAIDEHWEIPETLEAEQWERLREVGASVAAFGERLSAADPRYLPDAGTTTANLGSRLVDAGSAISERAEVRLSGDVTHVLRLSGVVGESFDVQYETLPAVEPPATLDGDATVTVRDADGEVLADRGVATDLSLLAQDGDRQQVDGGLIGTVPLPDAAASVELSASADAGTVTTSIDPTTDPIRVALETLPDRAFAADLGRSEALDRLDRIGDLAADGDHEAVATNLESLYSDLHETIPGDYTPESADEPTRDRVLALVGQQLQRFGGEVPDLSSGSDDVPRTWMAAGAGGALLGTYALKRAWDRRGDGSTE